jgi:hypothetical protein
MALKAVLETLEGVDDAIQSFYTEANGKYVLSVEGVDDHPEVANLRNAYSRTKEDREKAKSEAQTLKAQIEELRKTAPDTAATQARLAQMQEQLEAATAQANEWQSKYVGKARDEALLQSLMAAGVVDPGLQEGAIALLSRKVKLGDDGTPYVESDMGPKVLGDYVKAWASGAGKSYVSPASGGGATGSKGGTTGRKPLTQMTEAERREFKQSDPDAFRAAIMRK